ncbi:MAG: DUF3558 domain-containing protein [Pseudonocardiaceae bacterium]
MHEQQGRPHVHRPGAVDLLGCQAHQATGRAAVPRLATRRAHPRVPADLAAVADDPCALLTPQQLEAISSGLATSTSGTPWGQTRCTWENDELSFAIAPDTRTGGTIGDLLRSSNLMPVEVAGGYPAAEEPATDDNVCGIYVAVDKTEVLVMTFYRRSSEDPEHKVPCEFLKSIAAMTIENIPPKS